MISLSRSYFYYTSKKDDSDIVDAIIEASKHGDGFWKIFSRLRRQGHLWNHKRVYRVYKTMCYNKRRRLKKRLPARVKEPLVAPEKPNVTWSMDFVSDSLDCGRRFRVLNIIDDFNREAITQEIAISMPAERVIRTLEKTIWVHGKPDRIRVDNGPEFISSKLQDWCKGNEIAIKYTQPGKPTQNSYIERFNGSYRRAVLDAYIFRNLSEVRKITQEWQDDYNNNRPHLALKNLTPKEFAEKFTTEKTTNNKLAV